LSGRHGRQNTRSWDAAASHGGLYREDDLAELLRAIRDYSVALLAAAWRSEELREQQRLVGSIGPQGERLRRVVAELDGLERGREQELEGENYPIAR
jgi:hypothetical protein